MEGTIVEQPCPKCGAPLRTAGASAGSGAAAKGPTCGACGYVAAPPAAVAPPPAASTLKTTLMRIGLGLLSAGIGSTLLYLEGFKPYQDALDGAQSVEISFSAALVAPFLTVVGLIVLVPFPKPSKDGRNRLLKAFQWTALAAIVVAVVAGIVGYFWLRLFLKDRGYAF